MTDQEFETNEERLKSAKSYRDRILKLNNAIVIVQSANTKSIQVGNNCLYISGNGNAGPFKPINMDESDISEEFKDAIKEVLTKRKAKLEEMYFKL